jgi:hypothetical protein
MTPRQHSPSTRTTGTRSATGRLALLSVGVLAVTGLAAAPAEAATYDHTAVFDCQVSAGHATITLKYSGSDGNIIRAKSMKFTTSVPFDLNALELIRIQADTSGRHTPRYVKTWGGTEATANDVKSGMTYTWPDAGGTPVMNVSTDLYLTRTTGAMYMQAYDGVGTTKTCFSREVTVQAP